MSQQDEQATDLAPLIPSAERFLENQSRSIEENARLNEKRIEVSERNSERAWHLQKRRFLLLAACTAAVFAIASGLIFWKNNVSGGLTILSHVGAVVAGLLAGIGWEKSREQQKL